MTSRKAVEQLLAGIDGALNYSDDIIVFGSTKEEHDRRLEKVLQRLQDNGLTVNEKKCEFGKTSLDFFGLKFSQKGISLDNRKFEAILNAKSPSTAGEVRSLLGLANYCARFIPDFATITEPLRELIKKIVTFNWEKRHEQALQKLKKSICVELLSYFDPKLRTEITVDASPVGVAEVLAQYDVKSSKDKRIVMYASRSLSKVEQKYSQVEREALA
ncbi:unnamed protein product, partial [Brachionus calyciflorus]